MRDSRSTTFPDPWRVACVWQNLGFQAVQHDLATARLDCQVTKDQGIYILVTGVLSADGAPPMAFCETFILHQNGASWYIHNQIFRLNLT